MPEARLKKPHARPHAQSDERSNRHTHAQSIGPSDAAPALTDWLGTSTSLDERLSGVPLAAMAATLDCPVPLSVPPLWHWLYFLPIAPASAIGPDGHPVRGGFLPPVPLPRRMWAGGRLTFHEPLRPETTATRVSTIENLEEKTGRTGPLVFVTVSHRISSNGVLCLEEEHDIVYREAPAPKSPHSSTAPTTASTTATMAPSGEAWSRSVIADPVLLFRYSALTFNGHRIHYDHPYVTAVEGYPGLVVHGPLIATLLADLIARHAPTTRLQHFAFRAVRPTFANHPFTLCGLPSDDGKTVSLWAKDQDGFLTMQATAALA